MKPRLLLPALMVASCTLAAAGAELPVAATQFEGVWQVARSRPRPPRAAAGRDPGGRTLGVQADEKGLTTGDYRVRRMMTDAGRAAFDEFDPHDLPANNCESPGLPSIAMTPNLQDWRFDGDTLRITHEYYSTKRAIHLDAGAPEDLEHTAAGFAAGRFEGDTLVIETSGLAATLGGLSRNAPASDARVVTERYRVLPDGDSIEGQIVIEDEKFLTRTIQLPVRLRRAEPGTEIVLFPCDKEAARRHLDP